MKLENYGWIKLAESDGNEIQMYSDDKIMRFDIIWNEVDWKMIFCRLW